MAIVLAVSVLIACTNEIPVFTVRFDSQGGSVVSAKETFKGSRITEPAAPTRANHEFGGWYKDASLSSAWDFDKDLVMSDIALYAKWNAHRYAVTYQGNGNETGTVPQPQEKTHGTNLILSANTGDFQRTGYRFAGWNTQADGSGTDYAEGSTYTSDTALTLYAKWTANSYSVTYDANGATGGTVPDVKTKIHEVDLALAANKGNLVRTGYSFAGWNTQADGSGTDYAEGGTYTFDGVLTLYAKWVTTEYAVMLDKQEGSGGSDSIIATYDSAMPPATVPARDGYLFDGYYDQIGGAGNQYYSATMESLRNWDKTDNSKLYAKWTLAYTVSFNSQSGSSVSSQESIRQGSRISEPTAPTRNGYAFDGWFKDSSCVDAWHFNTDIINSNTTLYAKWVVVYTVGFDSRGGSSIAPLEGIRQGSKITQPTVPTRNGYDFNGWYKDSECTIEWKFGSDTVETSWTLYAKWVVALYSVNFNSLGGTDVDTVENILYGTKISEPVSPVKSKHVFGGWYRDSSYAQRYYFTTDNVTSSMTLYAKWIPPSIVTFES